MLWVYELRGKSSPRSVPNDGLAGVWREPPYYYLFYRRESLPALGQWLESNPGWRLTSQYNLPYETWQDISLVETQVGPFRIRTAPGGAADSEGTIPIVIDPGIVFGSGLHPTTQGCLLAIAEVFSRGEIRTALDFGTGTGILAVACALLGAESVIAVDCNPLAATIAARNAETNGVGDRIAFVVSDRLGVVETPSDLLVMNIEWPFMEGILKSGEWRQNRRMILSGFLPGKLEEVKRLVSPFSGSLKVNIYDGWPVVIVSSEG